MLTGEQTLADANRVDNFRQMSFAELQLVKTLVLSTIETDLAKRADHGFTFGGTVDLINSLLENVKLVRTRLGGREIHPKQGVGKREPRIA